MTEYSKQLATVLSCSRRNAKIWHAGEILKYELPNKTSLLVGDKVLIENSTIKKIETRSNCLSRSYFNKTKEIVANLDLLFVVSATGDLFNTVFVDRVLCVARLESIPVCLIVNKVDLKNSNDESIIATYRQLDFEVVETTAKDPDGVQRVRQILSNPDLRIAAFVGVSGVGKTTIMNQLIPGLDARTSEVSHKTGQGRQTTSMAEGYIYEREDRELVLVDLPGIHNFGVTGIDLEVVKYGFSEFNTLETPCEYDDCLHDKELTCSVKSAVSTGKIAESRYHSYINIINEIKSCQPY